MRASRLTPIELSRAAPQSRGLHDMSRSRGKGTLAHAKDSSSLSFDNEAGKAVEPPKNARAIKRGHKQGRDYTRAPLIFFSPARPSPAFHTIPLLSCIPCPFLSPSDLLKRKLFSRKINHSVRGTILWWFKLDRVADRVQAPFPSTRAPSHNQDRRHKHEARGMKLVVLV